MCKSRFPKLHRVVYGSSGGGTSVCSSLSASKRCGSVVVYQSLLSLGGGAFQFHGLPSVKWWSSGERLFSSSSWCLAGDVQNQSLDFNAIDLQRAAWLRVFKLIRPQELVLFSRVGQFTGLRYYFLDISVVLPTLGGSCEAAGDASISVSRFGRNSSISW
ncbi:hypothetical protein F2Q70_00013202 [Brassica cretica]|uniref:Uncharacterized protein n=1 Tax=Brassica cretica TaxID=69181 RepID=A0A3N6R9W7_BRACR|nr:hypothetical protein F2Q70_00013202 [Brassica cretica]KAF3552467.1 hypothetical protein DY000_02009660 [Brassica cretica]